MNPDGFDLKKQLDAIRAGPGPADYNRALPGSNGLKLPPYEVNRSVPPGFDHLTVRQRAHIAERLASMAETAAADAAVDAARRLADRTATAGRIAAFFEHLSVRERAEVLERYYATPHPEPLIEIVRAIEAEKIAKLEAAALERAMKAAAERTARTLAEFDAEKEAEALRRWNRRVGVAMFVLKQGTGLGVFHQLTQGQALGQDDERTTLNARERLARFNDPTRLQNGQTLGDYERNKAVVALGISREEIDAMIARGEEINFQVRIESQNNLNGPGGIRRILSSTGDPPA